MNPFQPGQFLKAQDIRNIQDGIKKRIIEGKGIKVFSSGNQIIIEKKKIHRHVADAGLPVYKHGGSILTPNWVYADASMGWDIDDWNTAAELFNSYNLKGCEFVVLTQESDVDSLFPDVSYTDIDRSKITFVTDIVNPFPSWLNNNSGVVYYDIKTTDCAPSCFGGKKCYNTVCYDPNVGPTVDPDLDLDHDYWAMSQFANPFDTWHDACVTALDSIGTLETTFSLGSFPDGASTVSRMRNAVYMELRYQDPWSWGGTQPGPPLPNGDFWLEWINDVIFLNKVV